MQQVEKWDVFEIEMKGKSDGNPFIDYQIKATFTGKNEEKTVDGFYDGDGIYRVRFMPSFEGEYHYVVEGSFAQQKEEGTFLVTPPSKENHGPVRIDSRYHFQYEDGAPYYSIGTTCYAWVNQPEELQEQTLNTLKSNVFNKIRFCIFPKHYLYNMREPITYPYERGNQEGINQEVLKTKLMMPPYENPIQDFNCLKPNPEHFKRFDLRIRQLRDMGIEADIILWHPYDRWGFAAMTEEADDLYLNYMVARYGAYRNVWWSLANEYDLMSKTAKDWERFAGIICEKDPYNHLRSIHNCIEFYDYTRPWITHCSMQRQDLYRHVEYTDDYRRRYGKPVVWDEIAYEGNVDQGWGNITAEELVRRFWEAVLRGGYPGHGETYMHPEDIIWWSHGGVLHGESPERFQFLYRILCETPGPGLKCRQGWFDETIAVPDTPLLAPFTYEIRYYGFGRPSFRMIELPADGRYQIEIIDTWNMTITDAGIHSNTVRLDLPGKQYMAIRIQKV
jgi:hypothetical protein